MVRKEHLLARLDNIPQSIEIEEPAGGYFIWVADSLGVSTANNSISTAIAQGISVASGDLFSEQGKVNNTIRLLVFSYELTEKEQALILLGKLAHKLTHS